MDYGTGVSRTLDAVARQFSGLVWQEGKPPLDSELNYVSQVDWENLRQAIRSAMPSGFLMDPTRAMDDYQFDPLWSNRFVLGKPRELIGIHEGLEQAPIVLANVNGWIIPVVGTDVGRTDREISNIIKLYPPPASDARIDYVFLEAWLCRVDANPSTVNKPSASTIWNYGNVKFGGTNLTDDLEDPAIGFSTTGRVQVQYRIRVYGSGAGLGASVALSTYPDGLGDPNILGQGTAASPVGGFAFANMREALGDPSLWRAGDGDPTNALGTVDGYVYAIPISAVFRRNTLSYLAVNQGAGHPNQNGAKDRTPHTAFLADPLSGSRVLLQASLGTAITATDTGTFTVNVTNLNGCGLEDPEHSPYTNIFLVIDGEYFGFNAIDLVAETIDINSRGRFGTAITRHEVGVNIQIFNTRPDGLYADQIAGSDILDLRRAVNPHDWDFQRLLQHNVASLVRGDLKTAWKLSVDGDTQGTTVHEVDYLLSHSGGAVPAGVQHIDGPDGIRTVFSDAACIQRDVTILMDPAAAKVNQYAATLDANVAWDVGPDFHPAAFFNNKGYTADGSSGNIWTNGSTIFLYLGGNDGISGARASFRTAPTEAVRAVMPAEYWKTAFPSSDPTNGNQAPVTMRFLDRAAEEPAPPCLDPTGNTTGYPAFADRHSGPMYPWGANNFEYPFIVLGGIVHSDLRLARNTGDITPYFSNRYILEMGINFDAPGVYLSQDSYGNVLDDPSAITKPLLNGRKTLWNLITNGGRGSSELYAVIYGDTNGAGLGNNGVFRIVGAGTLIGDGYSSTSIVVVPLCQNLPVPTGVTAAAVMVEIRSAYHNADDTSSLISGIADIAVCLTDLGGVMTNNPWSADQLGYGDPAGYVLTAPSDPGLSKPYIASKALLNMTLMYHPGRGAMAKVPDQLLTFAKKYDPTIDIGGYLRQSRATLDSAFATNTGLPSNETYWDPIHVQTWNRLPALGWDAPNAPDVVGAYGGNVVGFTEQDREHELFFDRGSKTVIFRPFRDREMTLQAITVADAYLAPIPGDISCLLGPSKYPDGWDKDSLDIWTAKKTQGFAVPKEFMPRFGRQDIPYWVDINAGAGPFLQGINHLFTDIPESANDIFNILGGVDNLGVGPLVKSMFFATGVGSPSVTADYCHDGTFPAPVVNQPYIGARKTTDITNTDLVAALNAVNSSDFGKGLKGIMLPPYYGPARIYGVYRAEDFQAKGGHTFNADRITPAGDPPPNLLKEDSVNQTLFILEGGSRDVTADLPTYDGTLDHTYIIPSNAIDITRALTYAPGDMFEDYHYVVECVVFGFARGFINQNNYVMTRLHSGSGVSNTDGDDPELEGIRMTIPAPAGINDNLYTAYNRTPYQGDPFMSRGGDALATSDYEERYGQLTIASQYSVRTPIQQFYTGPTVPLYTHGQFIPEIPNARSFEILASMDFYTTMGTGKIGGQVYPGTCLDVGYTEDNLATSVRMPSLSNSPDWRILPRAFTDGQQDNPFQARLYITLDATTPTSMNPAPTNHNRLRFGLLDGTYLDMYASFPDVVNQAYLVNPPPGGLGIPTDQIWDLDEDITIPWTVGSGPRKEYEQQIIEVPLAGSLHPGEILEFGTFLYRADRSGISVHMKDVAGNNGMIALQVRCTGANSIAVRAIHTWSDFPFSQLSATAHTAMLISASEACSSAIPPGTSAPLDNLFTILGAAMGDLVAVTAVVPPVGGTQAVYTAVVVAPDTIQVWCHNIGVGFNIAAGNHSDLRLAVVRDVAGMYAARTYSLTNQIAIVSAIRGVGTIENCAKNLATAINANPTLSQNMTAVANGKIVELISVPHGPDGNTLSVASDGYYVYIKRISDYFSGCLSANFEGGLYIPANAGTGNSQVNLTGMTERLPLGVLLQDSDFLCENPLDDDASAMKSSAAGPRPIQSIMPLTFGGEEYTRFMGEPGTLIAQSDGSVCVTNFTAWTDSTMGGTRRFRTYRGGGPAFVLSGNDPGGPIDWVSESYQSPLTPLLKGGVLVCRAMLVRNFYEEVNVSGGTNPVSHGDEIQMVIISNGILGNSFTRDDGITLDGVISPTGYGEGMAASDRYRINGRPMFRGRVQWTPNPNALLADLLRPQLAVYPDTQREVPGR